MNEDEERSGQRLDMYVVTELPTLSRASAAKLVAAGQVQVNDAVTTKSSYRVKFQDRVVISYEAATSKDVPAIDLPVIYEDEDCAVIIKPVGLLTHSKGAFNPEPTVATWLAQSSPHMAGERAGIAHRLDRATSGVMIVAKNAQSLRWLQKQFAQRRVKKTYTAIVTGELANAEALIDMPIERNPKAPQTFRAGVNGKTAQTYYKTLRSTDRYSLLELKPTTGRTHQLRVHLKQIGHPIVGDPLYGGEPASRMFLHATVLELTLPNRTRRVFTAEVPKEFDALLKDS